MGRKLLYGLAAMMLIGVVFTLYITQNVETVDSLEYVHSLVQEEYGIELTESTVVDIIYEPHYSRDYACVVSAKLREEYAQIFEESIQYDASWCLARNAQEIIDTYIEPSLSSFENLSDMKDCCMEDGSYIKLIVQEEELPYVCKFSVLVINVPKAELFYFKVK